MQAKENSHIVYEKTGLQIDPSYSALKISWLLSSIPKMYEYAMAGEILFGSIDSYLLWRFTKGTSHTMSASQASRTLLFNLRTQNWDDELIEFFNIPKSLFPNILNDSDDFGFTFPKFFETAIPICAMIGNQNASLIGQACLEPGNIRGGLIDDGVIMVNTGENIHYSKRGLSTTLAYQINGIPTFALEGNLFGTGSAIHWLKDNLKIIANDGIIDEMANGSDERQQIYFVPSFYGITSPQRDFYSLGGIYGITSTTKREDLVRAALESIGFQFNDLLEIITQDWEGLKTEDERFVVRVDGYIAQSNWALQRISDIANIVVERAMFGDTSSFGAAILAAYRIGLIESIDEFSPNWRSNKKFTPALSAPVRKQKLNGWSRALARTKSDF